MCGEWNEPADSESSPAPPSRVRLLHPWRKSEGEPCSDQPELCLPLKVVWFGMVWENRLRLVLESEKLQIWGLLCGGKGKHPATVLGEAE